MEHVEENKWQIHYQFLKHLPDSSLLVLLGIFNDIFKTGNFPNSWREATIVPIPKPGKDQSDPLNYRPIALTSCLCKTMERMVNSRLTWFLQTNDIITPMQSGFQQNRSTLDHLVRLETFIREAFIHKEHLVAIFFDLEKAFDTTWKYGIMKDLHSAGIKGRLSKFLFGFLSDRVFKVRAGATLSDLSQQEMGVPQGSILSVTLFGLKINSIVKVLKPTMKGSLFVDDILICMRSKNMRTIERQLQQTLNSLQDWADSNGFRFSKSKTVCVHFCQMRHQHNDPELTLDGTALPVTNQAKFLGVIFDKKLSFKPHIQYLKEKCLKSINLMKVIAHTDWGADRDTLLKIYRSLIRSKLDYGSIVYGSARKSYLKPLDTIHHQGLRLALGAFRTTPTESLYIEANEACLAYRREQLSLQYALRVKSNPANPAFDVTFNPEYKTLFEAKPSCIPTFGLRIASLLEQSNLHPNICTFRSNAPPWTLSKPTVDLSLHVNIKDTTDPIVYQTRFTDILLTHDNFETIYTDGSKSVDGVGSAFVHGGVSRAFHLPTDASIFTAESIAIMKSLEYIESLSLKNSLIFSDSLSVLESIKQMNFKNPILSQVLSKLDSLSSQLNIKLIWIPGHVGISGNEKADRAAKSALTLPIINLSLPSSDYKPSVVSFMRNKWQSSWDTAIHNKLHSIKPTIGKFPLPVLPREDEVAICRIRLGHTKLTHSYLLERDQAPFCVGCDEPLTIEHILIDCIEFSHIRPRFYSYHTMFDIFQNVHTTTLLHYFREILLYDRL